MMCSRTIPVGRTLGLSTLFLLPASYALANPSDTSYRLVFADEFNGTSLDSSKWSAASPGWTMPNSLSTATASQVSVGGGLMTMNATRTGANTWTSGSVSSYQKYNFAGGYVEARIQLPSTPGSWPAFWGLYNGWPPEADIMEYPLTTDGGASGLASNKYSTNFHYTNSAGAAAAGAGAVTTGSSLAGTTHTFAMDWTSGTSVRFLLDGNQVQSFSSSSVAQMANMYMILDYAVGGWPGTPSTSQWAIGASDQTKVDWVRVWQRNANNDAASTWNVNGGGSFTTAANWTGGGVPSFSNQTAVFGRVGTASTAAVTLNPWQVMGGITFDGLASGANAGTTAYTIGASSNAIQLASTAAAPVVQATVNSTASQNINAKVELWSSTTLKNDMTGGQSLNFNSEVSGQGAMNVSGVGTVVLNAPNTYTGGTIVGTNQEAAVLRANADGALGTGGVVIGTAGNATTARLEVAGSHSVPNNIDFRGRNNNSAGIESVSGNNTIGGTISANIGGGIFQIQSDAGTLTLSGAAPGASAPGVAIQAANGSRVFTLQGAGNGIVSGTIQNGGGTVAVTKEGAGTWTLANANTYTGPTIINGGTLRLAQLSSTAVANYTFDDVNGNAVTNAGVGGASMNATLANGAAIVSGGRFGNAVSLANGASVDINNSVTDLGTAASWTVSAWVKTNTAGSTILTKSNGGWGSGNTIFFLGDGTGAGSGSIPSAVRYGGGFFQGATNATPVADGIWHQVTYVNNNSAYAIYVDGSGQPLSAGNSSLSAADVGSIIRLGATTNNIASDGTVNFNGLLDGVQIYRQALSAGQITTLYQGATTTALPATASVTIASGAALDLNGNVQTIAALAGAAGSSIALGNGQLTINSAANNQFAGTISGSGSLVKSGAGTLILSGPNNYTGNTVITAGVLKATAAAHANLLTNAGGTDLRAGQLLFDYTGGADPVAQVKAILDGGYASHFAAGQIRSTTLAANQTIGYSDNGTDTVTLRLTLPGDADLNGSVDFNDFLALQANFGQAGTRFDQGNFNYDGATDFNDFLALQANFGQSITGAAVTVTASQVAAMTAFANTVPEPASLALCGLAGLLLGRRRRTA